ncbi:MAG: YlbF family regulator [Bacillota bacterium]
MSVEATARRLKKKLENSDEYQNYLELREKVMAKEGSKKMLLDYQNLMMEMQTKRMSGEELSAEDQEKLKNLQNFIEINNNVKKYLEAEYSLSKMINDIQKTIFSDIEVGIPESELKNEENESEE